MRVLRMALFPAVLFAILVLTLLVFRLPVFESLRYLVAGAFGDKFGWSRTLVKSTPLLLTGLGMVVAWRGGIYNIGGEGQFIMGGIWGAFLAKYMVFGTHSLPAWICIPMILLSCILGGASWAWIAGWLYLKRGVEVVISTILLNFIALQVLGYVVSGPLQEAKKQVPLTESLPDNFMLPKLTRQMDLHLGVLLALVTSVIIYIYLFRTRSGYRLRLVGENSRMARSNRIDGGKHKILAIVMSGALCGVAGGIEYLGMAGQLGSGFSQQWGFLGIPVALLGGLHPLLCLVSAFVFGALFAGSENLARFTTAGSTLVYVIQALAVLAYVSIKAFTDRQAVAEGAS